MKVEQKEYENVNHTLDELQLHLFVTGELLSQPTHNLIWRTVRNDNSIEEERRIRKSRFTKTQLLRFSLAIVFLSWLWI